MKGCSGSDNQGLQKRGARGAAAPPLFSLGGGAKCPWGAKRPPLFNNGW